MYSWHDAGTYDAKTKTGGANGSIRTTQESGHGANKGIKFALDLGGMINGIMNEKTFFMVKTNDCLDTL